MVTRHSKVSLLALALAASSVGACAIDPVDSLPRDPDDEIDDKPADGGVKKRDAQTPRVDSSLPVLDGGFATSVPTRLANIVVADRPPPSISGGSLTVTPTGDLAIAADPDRDLLYLVRTADSDVRTVQFPEGSEPGRVVLDNAGGVHVAMRNTGIVARVDLQAASVSVETHVCQLPRGLALDAAKNELLVACASGELVVLDATSHAEHSRSFLDLDLRDVVIGKDGQRFVSRYRSAELLLLGEDGKIASSSQPRQSKTFRLETDPNKLFAPGATATSPTPLFDAPLAGGRTVTMSATLAWKTVAAADGTTVMLHQQSQDDEVIISQAGGYGGGCEPITQPSITRYDAAGKPLAEPVRLGGGALIVDVAVSYDGKWFAVAKPGAYLRGERGTLEVITSTASSLSDDAGLSLPTALDAGSPAPDQFGPLADGGFGFVGSDAGFVDFMPGPSTCNFGSEAAPDGDLQTTAVAFDRSGKLYAFSRQPAKLTVYDLAINSTYYASPQASLTVSLSAESVADTGHDLFHGDVGTGLSCASCHGEALDDGHVWNFRDFGPRRTQNMRGGFLNTLPLHWEGDLPTFQNLVDEVMTRRMGGFAVSTELSSVLANWIDKQPAISLTADESGASARGKLLFESPSVQCSSCHSGSSLTNNETVDVGTGGLFQVPTLRGVGLHAPFMHDGCAVSLLDRFDAACGGGDRHGKTSQLGAAQLADLVAYLQTL